MYRFKQRGVGLVEVLVAVLLLSVAVLGFSALQLRAISATDESLVRTQALSVVRGLAENMRANAGELDTYKDAVNAADSSTTAVDSCQSLSNSCTSAQFAVKESNNAVAKLNEYDIKIKMDKCPSNESIPEFSKIKCVIAAWGDTLPEMSASTDACANTDGIYNSGSTCVIVEAY
ncbi:type IV pilus modification protein PilV [Psychrobacter urativorans]|uniref:type IV pilus modification protein PilV n=1 Tax=Psychrobacter urativorans TaxID=45610 RepID=UPI00191A9B3D|nr:type IV pilus modification protein PilV [Psychrobacter urativorans]